MTSECSVKLRRTAAPVQVATGERVLALAESAEGPVAATKVALYLPGGRRIPWEQVKSADWDVESETLRVTEVGTWGEVRPIHAFTLTESARLLQLVRERVTASVVLTRHVPIRGKRGVRVIARRAPVGRGELSWLFEYDVGIDPDDPFVAQAAEEALLAARDDVGDR
ncbi:MAG TPA: hypothetical protein PLZ93_14940 [Nocardioides sp.]|uniref:hypothetical protein n=1 Tax=uncultured Nocardioides sp. TaxID=198441 RepID=UPI000ED085B9|nr:hypothetical protein [uncultured Nocardioides sp.]HCB03617.1 hypothetical protein [Nocardioides sp.]HRD60829.1 hypothetical protein [Nocardioides sp.]HRI96910.1 hypothetical protein [Nocardioides sp.]HRK45036.1 hypothetical protein [Nocardioides sp.]